MSLKASRYNYQTKSLNNEVILYNSLFETMRKYDENLNYEISNSLKTGFSDDAKLIEDLKMYKFLINEDDDEVSLANYSLLRNMSNPALSFIILPTMACNFNCPYCYEKNENIYMSSDIQDGIIKYVKKNIINHNEVHLSWYGGEPLLAKDIIYHLSDEIQNICRKRYRRFSGSMTTNAYYLDIDTFKKLISYNVRRYQITIDGPKKIHDKQRILLDGGGTFDTIISNLKEIKKLSETVKFNISLRTNVSKEVMENLPEYISFMKENFDDDKRFSFFMMPVSNWGGDKVADFEDNMLNTIDEKVSIIKELCKYDNLNYASFYQDLAGSSLCYAGMHNNYVICVDGKIRKCTCEMTDDKDINNIIGIMDKNGDMNLDMYKTSKWSQIFTKTKCNTCNYYAHCYGNFCPNYALGGGEDCAPSKFNTDYILKLFAKNDIYINKYVCED